MFVCMIGQCVDLNVRSMCEMCGQWYVGVNGMWRSVVCGGQWYVGISAMWGKWHGRSTVCWVSLRSVI